MPTLGLRGADGRWRGRSALAVLAVAELMAGTLYVSGIGSGPVARAAPGRPAAGAAAGPAGRSSAAVPPTTVRRVSAGSPSARPGTPARTASPATGSAATGSAGTGSAATGSAGTGSGGTGSVPAGGATGSGRATTPTTGSGRSSSGSSGSGGAGSGGTGSGTAGSASQAPPVQCQTNLPLAQAPDAPYDFLCQQGGVAVTWSTNHIVIWTSGLTLLQSSSLAVALVQWELDARFTVSFTSVRADANVVITGAPLASGSPGYVEDGYTTVSYRCAPRCAYDSAAVELSTSAQLLQTDWISTILHELGHVAGLNHVSRPGEVMYPYLTALSPALYATGDVAGLSVLAAERGA